MQAVFRWTRFALFVAMYAGSVLARLGRRTTTAGSIFWIAIGRCGPGQARMASGEAPAISVGNLDRSTPPGDDFYRFANGAWLDANPTPPGEFARFGTFEVLAERNREYLKAIVEEAADDTQVGAFYSSGMNEGLCETAGVTPLEPEFQRISSATSAHALMRAVGHLHKLGVSCCFAMSASPDSKNSSWVLLHLYQSGLSLPDRDYYTLPDKAEIREKFVAHVAKMLSMLGHADGHERAREILRLETVLAEASLTRTERRDPHRVYNKFGSVAELANATGLSVEAIRAYFDGIGISAEDMPIIVDNPAFLTKLAELLNDAKTDTWHTYLRWHLLSGAAPFLSAKFVNEDFEFFQKTLEGQQEPKPRWKRVLSVVGSRLETPLAQLYVQRHFPEVAKQRCIEMVAWLKESLRKRLEGLEWMGSETKKNALRKLDAFGVKIGFPDKWEDYSRVQVSAKLPYVVNEWAGAIDDRRREIERLNKPVDRTQWHMPPFMVNAYFNPELNEIVFPAAILQPPFFIPPTSEMPFGDVPVNLGAIGAVIGHEMTHGFDDQGRKYAWDGNLTDWWTPSDADAFKARADVIIKQFDSYTVEGKPVNGKLTQGENIADLGGLKIAHAALDQFLRDHSDVNGSVIDGFTPHQRFFLSWAQIWRNVIRPEAALQRLITDPHAPGSLRVNGPLSNLVEFYKAFGVAPGAPMWRDPAERCAVW
ncbi:Peptidase M13 N-terminal domain-containing protein [Plasmodiophora brassicae]